MKAKHFIVVSTFHKAGTVLLKRIFTDFSKENSFELILINDDKNYLNLSRFNPEKIYFDDHGRYLSNYYKLSNDNFKFLQCIRDPRDLLVSATKYHQHSKEKWLHKEKSYFNGLTYNEMISKYPTFEEKCFFEIKNASYQTISNLHICSEILSSNKKNIKFVKLENLMQDYNFLEYKSIFDFFQIDKKYLDSFINVCKKNSVWNMDEKDIALNTHIQHKKPGIWRENLPKSLINYIDNKWPNLIQNLGYY